MERKDTFFIDIDVEVHVEILKLASSVCAARNEYTEAKIKTAEN